MQGKQGEARLLSLCISLCLLCLLRSNGQKLNASSTPVISVNRLSPISISVVFSIIGKPDQSPLQQGTTCMYHASLEWATHPNVWLAPQQKCAKISYHLSTSRAKWPAVRPDLNPSDHLCDQLGHSVHARVTCMRRRCQAVVAAYGSSTLWRSLTEAKSYSVNSATSQGFRISKTHGERSLMKTQINPSHSCRLMKEWCWFIWENNFELDAFED